jgi:hypothetical protein
VALGYIADLSDEQLRTLRVPVNDDRSISNSSAIIIFIPRSLIDPNSNPYGPPGFVVGIAALAIIVELFFIIVRICNIGLINLKVMIRIFLTIVSILSKCTF